MINFTLMDVTLRDGSYELNFQFSQQDVTEVGTALQNSGVPYIEIGHGVGLNASSEKHGVALCSDAEYLEAAQRSLTKSKYGMFCIPGIARVEDLDLLKQYGASFVRVGANTNVESIKATKPYMERAKELGLEVFANYMKTYTASPEEFKQCVELSEQYGADCLVIVDSAGCMFPEDIKAYYDIIKTTTKRNIGVGFHGHDNLGFSVVNTLYAASIGCDIVDTSLQSLGRGAGNASTEQIMAIFQKKHDCQEYELSALMKFSEEYLRPRVKFKGVSGLDTYCGIAGFHSGYMNSVRKFAKQYEVSPYDLIVKYCKVDRVYMDEFLLESIAQRLKANNAE